MPNYCTAGRPDSRASSRQVSCARLIELCRQDEIIALDLSPWFEVFNDDYSQAFATPFDSHPSALAHQGVAQALYHTIEVTCPELLREPSLQAGSSDPYAH
jgi:hypothetical protein